jgi:hypothetical protein
MTLGEINKGVVALLVVIVIAAGGFLWYKQMYTPAVADRATAKAEADTAQQSLDQAQAALAAAQQQLEASKQDASKLDDSVPRVQLARKAVPDKELVDDAAIVLMDLATQAGIQTSFAKGASSAVPGGDAGALQGATPIDLEFKAGGTYAEMMRFMSLVEGTVERRDGKLYTRDRLFNVVSLKLGGEEQDSGSSALSDGFSDTANQSEDGIVLGPKDMRFTVIVRMYTSSTENAQGVGAATPDDPAAAGIDPNAAAPADGGAAAGAGGATDQGGTGAPAGADPGTGAPVESGAATGGGI